MSMAADALASACLSPRGHWSASMLLYLLASATYQASSSLPPLHLPLHYTIMLDRHLEDGGIYVREDDDYFPSNAANADDEDYEYTVEGDYFTGADEDDPYYFLLRNGILALLCVVIAAIEAGLLMGCMAIDPMTLEVKARTAKTHEERHQAKILLSFVRRKHLVMVSIIIVNMGVNEALPVFLDRLVPSVASILISTTLVVLVGEVLPSAIFTGKDQIRLVYKLLPVLRVTILLTLCVSYPLAKFLDNHLHSDDEDEEEGERFNAEEISAYVRIKYEQLLKHQQQDAAKAKRKDHHGAVSSASSPEEKEETLPEILMPEGGFDGLCGKGLSSQTIACGSMAKCGSNAGPTQKVRAVDLDDVTNVERILSFREKVVEDSFTPLDQVFVTSSRTIVDDDFVLEAYRRGFSRIPVYSDGGSAGNICGVLLTSHLLAVDKTAQRRVGTMPLYRPLCCSTQTSIAELMKRFRGSSNIYSQFAIVCANPRAADDALSRSECIPAEARVRGIITFDDVLRSVFGHIPDEKSRRSNPSLERAKWVVAKWKCFVLNRRAQREQEARALAGDGRSRTVLHDGEQTSFQYRALVDRCESSANKLPEIV